MSALIPCGPFTVASAARGFLQRTPLRRWWLLWLALLWLALVPAQAQAQNVLVISTLESAPTAADNLSIRASMQAEFPTADWVPSAHLAGAVTAATFASKHYDLVLVAVSNVGLEAGNLAAINTAIQTRAANAFVMMYDTGGGASLVSTKFRDDLNNIGGLGLSIGSTVINDANFKLNTNSPFQGSFGGLDPVSGGWTYYMNSVPASNALYLSPGSTVPAAGSTATVNDVYGVFIPVSQSFGGQGACVLGYTDLSMFEGRNYNNVHSYPPGNTTGTFNERKLATAWLGMTQAGGACGLPAITKAFSPTSLQAGQTSTLTLTLTNGSGGAAANLSVTDNLPAPLVAVGTPTTTCTGATPVVTNGGSTVSLTGGTLPVAGCTITVTVQWPANQPALCHQAAPGNAVTNTITPGSDFTTALGQVRTPATAALTCTGATAAAAVPTLSTWLLSALGLLMAGFGWTRLRAASRA